MRYEKNYFRWNPEAYALLACQLTWFVHMGLLEVDLRLVVSLLAHAVVMIAWSFSYLWRAGEARRRRLEFLRVWGTPPCRICGARDGERCDAGLHS